MIWVPAIGLIVLIVSLCLQSWKSAETVAAMLFLNVACTAYQVITHDLLPSYLFIGACVAGALYLFFRRPRMTEFIIMCLIGTNVVIYGAYFFVGGESVHWLEAGNWVIVLIYCAGAGGAMNEHITRHLDGDIRTPVTVDSRQAHPGKLEDRQG